MARQTHRKMQREDLERMDDFLVADILGETASVVKNTGSRDAELLPITPGGYRQTSPQRQYKALARLEAAQAALLPMPGPSESLHLVVAANYRPWDLIEAMLRAKAPQTLLRLYISTLGYSRENVDDLCTLKAQRRLADFALISSTYDMNEDPARFSYTYAAIRGHGGRLAVFRNHCKVICAEFEDGTTYVLEGSANIRSCQATEQIVVTQDRGLFDFHMAWMEEALSAPQPQPKEHVMP